MTNTLTPEDLAAAVQGDLEKFSLVMAQPHEIVLACRAALPQMILDADAVLRVLRVLSAGNVEPCLVQSWASFVRRGYVTGGDDRPAVAVDIDWDKAAEEDIAEAVSRMDELGDSIDGDIRPEEMDSLSGALSRHHRQHSSAIVT